ncbi:MAG: hypothetical protein COX81_03010 [Candidatus Magasanikbacteria bacterium CG_4_10_14_0_2_um_filter_37_12]|uniref:Arginine-tRNA-protein transferase n=1 Tax=Candidatus Magasanikbacteria bacterium CG_4_10_14_0_2_um_filter_37_12 TaxID=1974637 RepID=A0A2M7V7E9_9BACT|nr:MAG: hypothetical protein COX81_03010 [Candidatus Magasanikbacteria bacterium CG_4_10_14_0_2_um_filter_37_12]
MYLKWNEQTIADFSDDNIDSLYNEGYVFTRVGKGIMNQTRSVRIDLNKFELSSENRRILRKTEELKLQIEKIPYRNYSWEIGKLAKDFYETKFGDGTFSANKVRELLTEKRDDFNRVLCYDTPNKVKDDNAVGYCIAVETENILHYSYPFYNLNSKINNLGMGMMIRAVQYAKDTGKQYIYLGSFQRPTDIYKLQFAGLQWFDGEGWKQDVEKLKRLNTKNT